MTDSPIRGAKEREDLVVKRGPVKDEHGGTGGGADGEAVNTLEALEDPAHGGALGRLVELVRNRLTSGHELLAQAVLGQAIDEQAQHHDQRQRDDALGLLEEDRGGQEERIFEEGKAALDAALLLGVGANDVLVWLLRGIQVVGGQEEARQACYVISAVFWRRL